MGKTLKRDIAEKNRKSRRRIIKKRIKTLRTVKNRERQKIRLISRTTTNKLIKTKISKSTHKSKASYLKLRKKS